MTLETQFQQPANLRSSAFCPHVSATPHHNGPAVQQPDGDSSVHGVSQFSEGTPHGRTENGPLTAAAVDHKVGPAFGDAPHGDGSDPNHIQPGLLNLLRWMTFAHGDEATFRPSLSIFTQEVVQQFDGMLLHGSEHHHVAERAITGSWSTLIDSTTDGEAKVRVLFSALLEEWQHLRIEHALTMLNPQSRYGAHSNALAQTSTSATSALAA